MSLEILERVERIAARAGFQSTLDEDEMRLVLAFDMGEGRRQMVFVKDTSANPQHAVVTIFSPCLVVTKELFRGISKSQALELLRANATTHFARYGISETESYTMVLASIDHLLAKLDPEEFEASVLSVAHAADSYEKKLGKDDF